MTQLVGPGALRLERHLDADLGRAWRHLVEPGLRATWLAGGALEPVVGGRTTLAFRHTDLTDADDPPPAAYRAMAEGGHEARGVVTAWEPPHRLAHTWEEGAESSEIAFELRDEAGGVRLTVVHRRLDTRAAAVNVAAGWDAHLGLLAAVLGGTPRPPYWRAFVASQARHHEAFVGRSEADGRPPGLPTLRALAGGGHRLEYARRVVAPVEAVWRALAEPALRDRWFPVELRFEGPVGGWARVRFVDDPLTLPTGHLTDWTPGRRLAFTFDADPASREPSVRHAQAFDIDLEADGDATRVAFGYGFGDRALAADVGAGWHACLDALAAVAEGTGAAAGGAALRAAYAAWLAEPFGEPPRGAA